MISYLEGEIIYKKIDWLIIKCGFIGYKVHIIPTEQIKSNNIKLYTYQHIREDKSDLYGFSDLLKLEIFETLISVSGLGPKMALSILASKNKFDIEKAIENADYKTFQEIKGIGRKLAAKIILELKNKIESADMDNLNSENIKDPEFEEALISLGFKQKEAIKISGKIPANVKSLEEKVKWALKNTK